MQMDLKPKCVVRYDLSMLIMSIKFRIGNGIRCLALFLKDLEKLESEEDITFDIWTLAGRMVVQVSTCKGA